MKYNFDELVLEVTRKCNLSCAHCLRGDQENLDMEKSTVDSILIQTSSIEQIIFTGGEPVLNVDLIEYTVNQLIEKEIMVRSFYVATNGQIVSERLALTLLKLYTYIASLNGDGCSQLQVSVDEFHENYGANSYEYGIYHGLSFFDIRVNDYSKKNSILKMGNAMENGFGERIYERQNLKIDYEFLKEGILGIEGTFYVNAKGEFLAGCDYSYYYQDDYVMGTVEDDIQHAIKNYQKKCA